MATANGAKNFSLVPSFWAIFLSLCGSWSPYADARLLYPSLTHKNLYLLALNWTDDEVPSWVSAIRGSVKGGKLPRTVR